MGVTVFDALPLSYGGDIVLDSTPFNVQLDGRGLAGWVDGWARVWKRSCTVSLRDDLWLPPRRAVGGGVVAAFIAPWQASVKPANWMIPATRFDRATSEL